MFARIACKASSFNQLSRKFGASGTFVLIKAEYSLGESLLRILEERTILVCQLYLILKELLASLWVDHTRPWLMVS